MTRCFLAFAAPHSPPFEGGVARTGNTALLMNPTSQEKSMRSFEIFVEPEPQRTTTLNTRGDETTIGPPPAPRSGPRPRPATEVLDLFIQGANVTARVAERHASCVLRDLAFALAELVPLPRG